MKKCSVKGCERKYIAKGLCSTHYAQLRKNGKFTEIVKGQPCKIDGCNKKNTGRGLCKKHYERNRVHGNPLIVMSRKKQKCKIEGCIEFVHGYEYCSSHYLKLKRYGNPLYNIKQSVFISVEEKKVMDSARRKAVRHFKGIKLLCFSSGCKAKKIELHHEDHRFPLEVVPFCRKHHMQRHAEIRREKFNDNLKLQEV